MVDSHPSDSSGLTGRDIIFYDGVCALCNRLVRLVLARDTEQRFRFAALQSQFAAQTLRPLNIDPAQLSTLYLLTNYGTPAQDTLARGRAALFVLGRLGGAWRATAVLRVLPSFLLDAGYRLVANVRYATFGRHESCPLPDAEHRHLFIGT
jgi:predicted DCC family thiol-disulfide oxidoreductase YuxK